MRPIHTAVLLATALLAGCTFVALDKGAQAVRVIPAGPAPAACNQLGEIEVDVLDRVGFLDRNPLRVREELESMARNEAVGLRADAVQPLGEPKDGTQRFIAWRCGAR